MSERNESTGTSILTPDIMVAVNDFFLKHRNKHPIAILFADMTDSTASKTRFNDISAWQNIILHNEICKKHVSTYKGTIIKYLGDGVMARFDMQEGLSNLCHVLDCAIKIQNSIKTETPVQTKIGIHICEPNRAFEIAGNDLIGFPIDIASRINEMAKPDQILLSENVIRMLERQQPSKCKYDIGIPVERNIRGTDIKVNIYELGWLLNGENEEAGIASLVFKGIDDKDKVRKIDDLHTKVIDIHSSVLKLLKEEIDHFKKIREYNIVKILPPQRKKKDQFGEDTKDYINQYLEEYLNGPSTKKTILAYGIALRHIFTYDSPIQSLIQKYHNFVSELEFRGILLDPNSMASQTRSLVECAGFSQNQNTGGKVYDDILQSIISIRDIKRILNKASPPSIKFDVKLSGFLPQMWFLMTDEVLFFEQYHIGKDIKSNEYYCLGGLVPVFQVGNKAPWYKYFRNQFEFLWTTDLVDQFGIKDLTIDLADSIERNRL